MGLFSIFSKRAPKVQDTTDSLSFLGADMHSHLLPNLDDGCKSVEESVQYIGELYSLGYRKLVCTPHIFSDMYRNNRETIEPAYQLLTTALAEAGINMELQYAAEFMVNPEFDDIISQKQILPFGDNYVLIEMSYLAPAPNIRDVLFKLAVNGYTPVLAHPERYNYYHDQFNVLNEFVKNGCLLQVNLLSLTGYYGREVKRAAEQLIKERMVAFAGTDLHHSRHMGLLNKLAGDPKIMNELQQVEWKNKTLL